MDDLSAPGGEELEIEYGFVDGGGLANEATVEECAALYSEHYGRWSSESKRRPGEQIRMGAQGIRQLLASPDSIITYAYRGEQMIGYAIGVRAHLKRYGTVAWVTQLVVHEDYRNQDVGKRLLFSMWGFSDHYAWGLVSANPYAIRALEKATRRRCSAVRIARHGEKLLAFGAEQVPYMKDVGAFDISADASTVFTDFFVDHSDVPAMLDAVTSGDRPWTLGPLQEGWEWFAFTFQDQAQLGLTKTEIDTMLKAADQVTRQAYSKMKLGPGQPWMRHTRTEVDFVISQCRLSPGDTVLDFGCGTGRHCCELASRGLRATGVDYLRSFDEGPACTVDDLGSEPRFVHDDCRTVDLGARFGAAICLYDVIGTYADDADNAAVLDNLVSHLEPGARVLLSVMNRTLTERLAKHTFSITDTPDELLKLAPSNAMEMSGEVFDPECYMIDTDTGVVYRKERFTGDRKSLPVELIVRDRRYNEAEMRDMCERAGLEVVWVRHVRAGHWDEDLGAEHDRAKEILLLCEYPG